LFYGFREVLRVPCTIHIDRVAIIRSNPFFLCVTEGDIRVPLSFASNPDRVAIIRVNPFQSAPQAQRAVRVPIKQHQITPDHTLLPQMGDV